MVRVQWLWNSSNRVAVRECSSNVGSVKPHRQECLCYSNLL